jgi:uncharacterized cupredoxin-like copper-binding protein
MLLARPHDRLSGSRLGAGVLGVFAAALALGCASGSTPAPYTPQERSFVLTTVPLLTKEMTKIYPFLREDFARGGVLEGREVYAFLPSTLTVVEGDTIHFTLVNPEDDAHDFVLPDLVVALPGQSVTEATWRADRAGTFPFVCTIPAHMPAMYGQLVVLPEAVGRGFAAPAPGRAQ